MKVADLAPPAPAVLAVKKKRATRKTADAAPGAFLIAEPAAIDAPMWPLHAALWFQPELAPTAPAWSDLAIERRHRAPAPDVVAIAAAPANRKDAVEASSNAIAPEARPQTPDGGLAPLGWDPRVLAGPRKEGDQ